MYEIWKDVVGYENIYQISSFGNLKRCERKVRVAHRGYDGFRVIKEKFLTTRINNSGYIAVKLCKNAKYQEMLIHRLVAQAFIPNPDNFPCVNHKDQDKTNNHADNLEWCTYKYNDNYGNRNKKISEARIGMKFSDEHKKNLSIAMKKNVTPEFKEKMRNMHLGKPLSDEHKKKISEGMKRLKT